MPVPEAFGWVFPPGQWNSYVINSKRWFSMLGWGFLLPWCSCHRQESRSSGPEQAGQPQAVQTQQMQIPGKDHFWWMQPNQTTGHTKLQENLKEESDNVSINAWTAKEDPRKCGTMHKKACPDTPGIQWIQFHIQHTLCFPVMASQLIVMERIGPNGRNAVFIESSFVS